MHEVEFARATPSIHKHGGYTPGPVCALKSDAVGAKSKHPVGWRVFSLLAASATILYFQQRSLTVAAAQIMPELKLSQMQIGWLEWTFVLSYGCLQFLAAILGPRFGARWLLFTTGMIAVAATLALPLSTSFLAGNGLFAAMIAAQFVLGASQAPYFALSASVMETWLPPRRWAFAQGVQTMFCQLGAALVPPVIVLLMQLFGWRAAVIWTSLPAVGLYAVWLLYVRDDPRTHRRVSQQELAGLSPPTDKATRGALSVGSFARLFADRDVMLLTVSYFCMNYAFYLLANWSFLYLIQERQMTTLQGGWMASLPPLGAAVGAGIGGGVADAFASRIGVRWGYRIMPLTALPIAGALLLFAVYSPGVYAAVVSLFLCFMALELTEGSYWASIMRVGKGETMAAASVFNTGGNLGGMVGIPMVAYLSGAHYWNAAFAFGSITTVLAALAWLGVDVSRGRQGLD